MSWLSSAKYQRGSGYIELAFDPNLKPYLLQLKTHFTQYKLDKVLHFKSIYSIRLYELLKKEVFKANKNGQFTVYFEYEDLREKFGIGKKEYLLFGHFKAKTIEPATREITDKTDLIIADVIYGKTGRKITNITFSVGMRTEQETKLRQANLRIEDIQIEKSETGNHPIVDKMVSLGFPLATAKKFKNKYAIGLIERNIAYTLAKKTENIPAYLNMAIENDYAGGAWEAENAKKAEFKKQAEEKERAKQEKELKEEKARLKQKELYQETFNRFLGLSLEEQNRIKEEFSKIADAITAQRIRNSVSKGESFFKSAVVLNNFKSYLVGKGF